MLDTFSMVGEIVARPSSQQKPKLYIHGKIYALAVTIKDPRSEKHVNKIHLATTVIPPKQGFG